MRRLMLAAVAATVLVPSASASGATATKWLCHPGVRNPCNGSLTTTDLAAGGRVEPARAAAHPPIDCFYVYPTVSSRPGLVAPLAADPEIKAIATYQAARFSQDCRVYAPLYRQVTLRGIADPARIGDLAQSVGYGDVLKAWREYLRTDNHGRGVVLIGHSQGSFVLRRLIREQIDNRPAVRRRLVSALLLGGNVLVRKGRDAGGDFRHVRACRSASQLGCVVAYSSFGEVPPADAIFGRTATPGMQVLCTNPAALGGGTGTLKSYIPAAAFPGALGVAVNAFIGRRPKVSTPWLRPAGRYTAHCSTAGGASVLRIASHGGARPLQASPTPQWGLHLGDVNLALGSLTGLVAHEARAYLRR